MNSVEKQILQNDIAESYITDLKSERDRLRKLLDEKPHPIFDIQFGPSMIWKDLIGLTQHSDGWLFGLWVLCAAIVGTGSWAIIYSLLKFWAK